MTTAISEVIMTADNPEWLTAFTRQLVEERWCACGQQINPIRSIYRWRWRRPRRLRDQGGPPHAHRARPRPH
jgi:hypothetical protein